MLDRARNALSARWQILVAALVVGGLCWPVDLDQINRGLDSSYAVNLHLLADSSLTHGRDVVFLYGPLGYLAFPGFVSGTTSVLAIFVNVAVAVALAYRLMVLVNRVAPKWVAVLASAGFMLLGVRQLTIVPHGSSSLPEMAILLIACWSVDWVVNPAATAVPPAGIIALTAFATAFGMVKAQLAVVGLILAAAGIGVRAWTSGGRRQVLHDAGLMIATAVGTLLALWVLTGQSLGALPDYVRGSLEIVGGYSTAMNRTERSGDATAAAIVAIVILVLIVTTRALSPRRRAAATLTIAAVLILGAKEGFVRSDDSHTPRYFLIAGAIGFVCTVLWSARSGVAIGLLCTAFVASIVGVALWNPYDPIDRLEWATKSARFALLSSYRNDAIDQARARLREQYKLPEEIVSRVDGHTVEIEPYETGIQFAYPEFTWKPAPVFHRVNAYTSYLDELNADALSADDRPKFVLRERGQTIDDRFPRFDAPSANLAIACGYQQVFANKTWQLLRAGADRCGAAREIATADSRLGETVEVPSAGPDEMVIARFDRVGSSLRDRLQSTLLAGREFTIAPRSPGSGKKSFRFLPGTQADDHIMSVPECLADEVEGDSISSFALESGGSSDAYSVTFLAVPVRC